MAKWNRPVITTKGVQLLQSTLNGKTLQLTDVKVSDINSLTDEMLPNLSQLDRIKKSVPITNIELIEDKLKVTAIINNEGERDGYELRAIGIYSHNDLFAVVTASNSDFIPPDMGDGVVTINFDLILSVDRNANFSIDYNSKALLKLSDLNSIVSREFAKKANITDVITDVKLVDRTIKVTKNGSVQDIILPEEVHDSTDSVAGKISKNSIRDLINAEFTSRNYQSQIDYLTNNKLDKNKALTKEQVEALISMATYDDLKNNLTDKDGEGILVPYGEEELRLESFVKNLTDEQRANCIRSPKKRLIALNSDAFVDNCLWSNKLINIAMNNDAIRNDVLNSPKALKKLFGYFVYINECLKLDNVNGFYEMFKSPKILDVTLMSPKTMKDDLGNQEILYILKLFTENESVRNNEKYAKEIQKYTDKVLKSLSYSNGDWQSKILHFYREDYPNKLNDALGYNMVGLVTLGAYGEGTDRECIMYTGNDIEIARGNTQKLNDFTQAQTITHISAIAFEGYKFKENNDGYITMVAFQLIKKGV